VQLRYSVCIGGVSHVWKAIDVPVFAEFRSILFDSGQGRAVNTQMFLQGSCCRRRHLHPTRGDPSPWKTSMNPAQHRVGGAVLLEAKGVGE
jgi:hypothetical protein